MPRLGLPRLISRAGLAFTNDASLKGRPVARLLMFHVLCGHRYTPGKIFREGERVGRLQSRGRLLAAGLAEQPGRKQCRAGKRQHGDQSDPFHNGKVLGGGVMGCLLRSCICVTKKLKTIAAF